MKIFLSWSGTTSHKVAIILRDWIPSVIQSVEPYVSSEDIDKGARWSTDIAKELEDSAFGILCVTPENLNAPWLTFEAGALSKKLDKSFVSPFLYKIKRAEIDGPILQFQSTIFEKEDILKLLKTINKALDDEKLDEQRLEKTFQVWYPNLEEQLNNIDEGTEETQDNKEEDSPSTNERILEEILELTRINQKILRSPDVLLPRDYVKHVLEDESENERIHLLRKDQLMLLKELEHYLFRFRETIDHYKSEELPIDESFEEQYHKLASLVDHFHHVNKKLVRSKRFR